MSVLAEAALRLQLIPDLVVRCHEPIAPYTRFAIGGPAAVFCQSHVVDAFAAALELCSRLGVRTLVIGGGSNLVVSDDGFAGVVLRFTGSTIGAEGTAMRVEAGAVLQDVVDRSIALGLQGMETMTGIPGYVGGAVYGNAGAYGHSMQEVVQGVTFTDGRAMTAADPALLNTIATDIRRIRDAKYPPDMKCAGSIFKNVFLADLPPAVQAEVPDTLVRDGKVPSAWFLEQAGVKGLRRGDIQVAAYHANLIYNDGQGTAADLVAVIRELKDRVQARFGFAPEEEVQYVGFEQTV